MGIVQKVMVIMMGNEKQPTTGSRGHDVGTPDTLGTHVTQALHPLTPLLVAAAFAVTAMTLVGSLLVV